MKYLVSVTEVYRIDSEKEVENFLAENKQNPQFELVKYNSTRKQRKAQGEIVDEWFKVSVTKAFNDEKEPTDTIHVQYEVE